MRHVPSTGNAWDIREDIAVAIYPTHYAAETAIMELERAGVDMKKLSIVGKDYHTEEHVTGYYTTGDRMMAWGKFGAFWGGLWGLMLGSASFFIPGIGPVLMAGPLVSTIVSTLEGAVLGGGVSALGAALLNLGVSKKSVIAYETELAAGKFILIVHGTPEETAKAKSLLQLSHHEDVTALAA
jgi:uncharacterized membrane protein